MRNNNTMMRMKSKGERPLFCSSNSSSPTSSSSSQQRQRQRHNAQFTAAVPQMHIYENQHRRQVGSTSNWLGNNKYECDKEEPEGVNPCNCDFNIGTGAASKLHEEHGRGEESAAAVVVHVMEKEHMFNKVVTPSDVGKLNRLVIPKQHAEKYFPLDSSTNHKGLLLNFEDRNGKSWRFRYSYWSSSQSYVMTKGWSRFVKDKKLDAGDIVSFQRGLGDSGKDRLYIDWRRRPDVLHPSTTTATNYHQYYHHGYGYQQQHPFSSITWSPLLMNPTTPITPIVPRDPYLSNSPPNINAYYSGGGSYGYGPSCYGHSNYSNAVKINPRSSSLGSTFYNMRSARAAAAAATGAPTPEEQQRMAYESVPVIQGKAAAKRLRLFGVNMLCPITAQSHECDALSSNINTPHAKTPLPAQQQ